MAKEIALGKRAKISEAQQNMLLSVLGASVILGVALALTNHFIKQISFNAEVIMAEDKAIVSYSNAIRDIGVCTKPSGSVYSSGELEKCDPNSIEVSEIQNTLRSKILEDIAANEALNSVPKDSYSGCINPETNKDYTYKELNKIYNDAQGSSQLQAASQLIKVCSALRIIPDALPAFKNEDALLASLNKLFNISNWQPRSISPSGSNSNSKSNVNPKVISVTLSVDSNPATTMRVLNNIERSIREFNIERATIGWSGVDTLTLKATANAYYINESSISEVTETIKGEEKK